MIFEIFFNFASMDNSSIRVAFDGRAVAASGAWGAALRRSVGAMARKFPGCSIDVYVPYGRVYPLLEELSGYANVNVCRARFPGAWPFLSRWRRGIAAELVRRDTGVFHAPGDIFPHPVAEMPGIRKVVTVRDLSFLSSPSGFTWLQRHRNNVRFRRSCRRADAIVVPSAEVAADVVKYYFIRKDRIFVAGEPEDAGAVDATWLMSLYEGLLGR